MLSGFLFFVYSWLDYRRYIPPFALLIEASVLLLLVFWAIWKLLRRSALPRSPLAWPLIAFLGATTLSTIFSIDPRRSFDELLVTMTLVLMFFLVCDILLAGWRSRAIVNSLLWAATITLVASLWATGGYFWEWWVNRTSDYPLLLIQFRLLYVFDHANVLAALINLALPFAILRLSYSRTLLPRIFWVVWLLGFVVVLFFTRSRGGLVAAGGATTITVGWLIVRYGGVPWREGWQAWSRRTWPVWTTALVYAGMVLLLLRGPDMVSGILASSQPGDAPAVERSEFTSSGGATVESAVGGRMEIWSVAWHNFLAHPLLGSGPATYGYRFVEEMHIVRTWLSGHAHNLYIHILGNQGIVGIATFAWVVLAGLYVFVRRLWHLLPDRMGMPVDEDENDDEPQVVLVGVCAALAGFLTHSLVDVVGSMPTNNLLVVLLAALGLHAAGALERPATLLSRWTALVLVVPLALGGVLLSYNRAQEAMFEGIAATLNHDWARAAQAMDLAVDADPQFVFYYGQRGYAYSYLAGPVVGEGDPQARSRALASYAVSLRHEPPYIPHLLNAAALYEQAGMSQQATRLLEHAVALPQAQRWALPGLLLAERYAEQGNSADATNLFATAFRREASAPGMAACRRSAACRAAAQEHTPRAVRQAHAEVQQLLVEGDPQQALERLQAIPETSADPLPWLDRAEAHIALGETSAAVYALNVADTLRKKTVSIEIDTIFARVSAQRYLAEGQVAQAISALEREAYPQIDLAYGYSLFHRLELPGSLHPQVAILQHTDEGVRLYALLADLYEQQGRDEEAAWARGYASALATLLEPDAL
jgi:O-antigen ligase/tetratricopeptide (TPR) repeat protein